MIQSVRFAIVAILISLAMPHAASASQVEVYARCRAVGPTNTKFDFKIFYQNPDRRIAAAELVNGMAAWGNDSDLPGGGWYERWHALPTISMTGDGRGGFAAELSKGEYEEGAGFFFLDFRFAVRLVSPDGSIEWDNAGHENGFYDVQLKKVGLTDLLKCGENEPFVWMDVTRGH